jgi:DNA-binding MarR family transcriptional regulator
MSTRPALPYERTLHVRDTCLCLFLQQAARSVARCFDDAFRPLDLTNGQFSLLMSLNRPRPPAMGEVAEVLAMDRTTLTAALKPLARRGLIEMTADEKDKRTRRLSLTDAGRRLLEEAYPVWEAAHREIDASFSPERLEALRADLKRLAMGGAPASEAPPSSNQIVRP